MAPAEEQNAQTDTRENFAIPGVPTSIGSVEQLGIYGGNLVHANRDVNQTIIVQKEGGTGIRHTSLGL